MTATLDRAGGHTPVRTCVVCRRRRDKSRLLRLAKMDDAVHPDPENRLPGRGAYVCRDGSCIERLRRRNGNPLRRAFPGVSDNQVRAAIEAIAADPAGADEHQRSTA